MPSICCTKIIIYYQVFPVHENQPVFFNAQGVISQIQVRTHQKKILSHLNFTSHYTFFPYICTSGATLAFHSGVDISHIKRHGTLLSDAVQSYSVSHPQNPATVSYFCRTTYYLTTLLVGFVGLFAYNILM